MLNIAVCDDDINELRTLSEHIERYAKERNINISVFASKEKDEIMDTVSRAEEFDCLFLDIYMRELNGIDLARRLRECGAKSKLVFFSTSKEHALDAFGVNAVQYLVKPVEYSALENALDMAIGYQNDSDAAIGISVAGNVVKLRLADVMYAEAQRNYQYIYMSDGAVHKTRMTSQELSSLLSKKSGFERLGASYIINLRYVSRVSSNVLELGSGKKIPVPRGSYAPFKQKYIDYFAAGGET